MTIVMFHTKTRRFRTGPGLCRGWSNHLGFAKHYATLDEAVADIPADEREHVAPGYVYVFTEPLNETDDTER